MKIELYKPYKTRGGHKAVVVAKGVKRDLYAVWHESDDDTHIHSEDGLFLDNCKSPMSIEKEWKEPRTFEVILDAWDDGQVTIGGKRYAVYDPKVPKPERIARKKITITEGEGV